MRQSRLNRILSVFVCVQLVLGLLPLQALAEAAESFESAMNAFAQTVSPMGMDDVRVTAEAEPNILNTEASLWVETLSDAQAQAAKDALGSVQQEDEVVRASYAFAVGVREPDGSEAQPTEGKKVALSFALPEGADTALQARAYRLDEEPASEKDESEAPVDGELLETVST